MAVGSLSERRPAAQALFGLGLLLPLLAGGNVLFLLEPDQGIRYFVFAVLAVTLLLTSVNAKASAAIPRRGSTAARAAAAVCLVVLTAWWCATLLTRPFGPRAITDAEGLFCAALLYGVFSAHPPRAVELRRFVAGLVVGCLVTTIYGQYQYWIMYPRVTELLRPLGREPIAWVNANFYNANCYAPFLAAVVVLALALFRGSAIDRALALAGIPVLLLTLALTGSRSTAALLILTLLVLGGAARGAAGRRAKEALVAAGLVALLVAAWTALSRVDLPELWRVGSLGRIAIWRGAWAMIRDHWGIGVGLGQFAAEFEHYQVTSYYTRYPHNLLLEVFAETGIVGAAALTGFFSISFAIPLRALLSLRDSARFPRGRGLPLQAFLLAAAALLLAHAMVDIDWHAPANPILLFTLFATAQRDFGEESA